jgi:hypothetical protein
VRAPTWRLEWRVALRRRRLLALGAGIPLLLVLPVALGGAPPHHAAAVYAVLFVLFGTMGSALPFLREGEAGLLRRIVLTGYPSARILLERGGAGATLDLVQLLPSTVAIVLLGAPSAGTGLRLVAALALALAASALVGIWVAALARSLAEGALLAAVSSLFLLHGSGVFRTAEPGSPGEQLAAYLPFGPLHRALREGVGIGPGGNTAGWAGGLEDLAPGVVATALAGALTLALAPWLLERITRRDG